MAELAPGPTKTALFKKLTVVLVLWLVGATFVGFIAAGWSSWGHYSFALVIWAWLIALVCFLVHAGVLFYRWQRKRD